VNRVNNNDKNNSFHFYKFMYFFWNLRQTKKKLQRATVNCVVLVRPSVLMSQLDWGDFCANADWEFLLQSVDQVQV